MTARLTKFVDGLCSGSGFGVGIMLGIVLGHYVEKFL